MIIFIRRLLLAFHFLAMVTVAFGVMPSSVSSCLCLCLQLSVLMVLFYVLLTKTSAMLKFLLIRYLGRFMLLMYKSCSIG